MCVFAVAPLAGAWIEIGSVFLHGCLLESLPSRERGLKFVYLHAETVVLASLPSRERGLKSHVVGVRLYRTRVAPLAGAWIEIALMENKYKIDTGRSPRGSVD